MMSGHRNESRKSTHASLRYFGYQRHAARTRFLRRVLSGLGYRRQRDAEEEIGYSADGDERCRLWIVTPYNKRAATIGNGTMVALHAETRADVDAFHEAALAHGGEDEGAPGLRSYHAHFYAAYVRDPDGNKICAVCESAE